MRFSFSFLLAVGWFHAAQAQSTSGADDLQVASANGKETIFIATPRIPDWMGEKGCGRFTNPFYHVTKARPCPTLSCAPSSTPPPACTPAPSSVAFPPYLAGVVDCTIETYTGPACSECGDNWCTRSKLPGETAVAHCPYGFQSATSTRYCDEPRCGFPSTLSSCPLEKPPIITDLTEIYTGTASCAITTYTGWPCSGCPDYCTVDGAVPRENYVACQTSYVTKTTDRACPSLLCMLAARPTFCPLATPTPTPWTRTIGCDVYVQTQPQKPCPSCHEICVT